MGRLLLMTLAALANAKPNLILILTDDQDVLLGSLGYMPNVHSLLALGGATLPWSFTAVPVCCPSRSSLLTGRYQHNTHVYNNSIDGNCSSAAWQQGPEMLNFAVSLKAAGYVTMFGGKLLNDYGLGPEGPGHIVPGFDDFQALVGNSVFYNYKLSNNGTVESHGSSYATDYLTDLVANRSHAFIERNIGAAPGVPFAVMLSTPACHEPADPAPQYADLYPGVKAPRLPNFNVRINNSHWFLNSEAVYGMDDNSIAFSDLLHRRRLQTLKSVDDAVGRIFAAVESAGQLNNTYFIFTSDNGYHLGEGGLGLDKRNPWDFDARVPFIIRGPGIAPNVTIYAPISLVDLAPTLLDLAGMATPPQMDGMSILPLLLAAGSPAGMHIRRETEGGGDNGTAPVRDTIFYSYHGEAGGAGPASLCPVRDGALTCYEAGDFDTPPHFNGTDFCSCQDSRNNTFACLRTVNDVANFRYCEFPGPWGSNVSSTVDGEGGGAFVEFYDLLADPYEMTNGAAGLSPAQQLALHAKLVQRANCEGTMACNS